MTQVDSKANPAVQLADVLIGAVLEACAIMSSRRTEGLDAAALRSRFKETPLIHMLPDLDFEGQRNFAEAPERLS